MDAPPFRFDKALSPQDNIEKFFTYMASVDRERTKLLKDNLGKMLPLLDGADRGDQREQFTREIVKDLDTVP